MSQRLLALASALLLAACSGSDDGYATPAPPVAPADPPVAGTGVPTSATLSSAGATQFVRASTEMPSDTAEPIELGDVQLASSDTDEPVD